MPPCTPPNPWEQAARAAKAGKLVAVCLRAGMTAAQAERATEAQRRLAARIAQVRTPSEATWALVCQTLRDSAWMDGEAEDPDTRREREAWSHLPAHLQYGGGDSGTAS